MDSLDDFYLQVEGFSGPVGLVYYIVNHVPKCGTHEECFNSILDHLRTINRYDPTQLHGVKTDCELQNMARESSLRAFTYDRDTDFDICTHAVDANGDLESQRLRGENAPRFQRWLSPTSIHSTDYPHIIYK